jgi:putative salt-induced outer membrane protein YdiY
MKTAMGIILVFLTCSILLADQLTLQNGDKLSGTIVKSDEKSLVIKTDLEGEVTVQWTAVQAIKSSQELHVGLTSGQTFVGPITTRDSNLEIATKNAGIVTIPRNNVIVIRSDTEERAYEKSLHPGPMEGWEGGANVGFALTHGNSQTKNFALSFTADRKTLRDKIGLYANSVYATNNAPGVLASTTANTIRGGIRYDRDFTERVFGFAGADFQTDDLQNLNLRSVLEGGVGLHALKSEFTTLDLLGGVNYTRENYSTFTRNFPAATLGEELSHKLRGSTLITQRLYFYPDLSDLSEYRGTFDFGTVTKISKWLGWQNSLSDIYVTNPPLGKKRNDIIFTTGLNVSFTRDEKR